MAEPKNTGDWQNGKSLSECMMYMFEKEIMCDITFRVGKDKRFVKAHKYMLVSRSSVFNTMFEGSCPEKGEVCVPDVNLETFNVMLRYIYSDVLDPSLDNMQEVLYIAETYMLSTMKDECLNQLLSSIETSNAHVVFDVASKFHLEHLKSKSLEYIQKNAEEYFTEPNAIQMSRDCIEAILELDSISCSETNICRFFIKWAGHQCEAAGKTASGENMRETTGSLLYLVRFPVINREYFANQIPSGFLTSEEVISVFSSHYGSKNEYFNESNRNSKRNLNVCRPSYTYDLSTDSLNKKIKLK